MNFREELEILLNKRNKENGSNTPDFILARFLDDCLSTFDLCVNARTSWYTPKSIAFEDQISGEGLILSKEIEINRKEDLKNAR